MVTISKAELAEEPTGGQVDGKAVVWYFYRYERAGVVRRTASFPTVERLREALLDEAQEAERLSETLRHVLLMTDPEDEERTGGVVQTEESTRASCGCGWLQVIPQDWSELRYASDRIVRQKRALQEARRAMDSHECRDHAGVL